MVKRNQRIFNIPGIGPAKEKTLLENGYDSLEKLKNADGYDLIKLPGFGFGIVEKICDFCGTEFHYPGMEEVTSAPKDNVIIENKTIKPWRVHKKTDDVKPGPDEFNIQRTTVWSFEKRGDWASHTAQYRGNWPPQLVRNVIELYTQPGDTVLDPMAGGGTTPVECLLTGRNSISIDLNPGAVSIVQDRLDLPQSITEALPKTEHRTFIGDTRNLDLIADESIDLIATHPPYVNIIKYAPSVPGDLSDLNDYKVFFKEFDKAIREFYRALKPGCCCAILIGDTHNKGHYVPVANRMMLDFLRNGFILKEDVIKREWNCESDRYLKKYGDAKFLLTMHEHLYIFEKPDGKKYPRSSIDFFEE